MPDVYRPGAAVIKGFDYASVDGNRPPDIEKTGASFVILRGAYPYSTNMLQDSHLKRDRDAWHAAGVPLGAYVILSYNPHGPCPEDQIDTFIAAYGDRRPGELPPWLDVEFPQGRAATGLTAEQALAWIERAYAALVKRYGIVGTYTSARVWHEDLADLPSKLGKGPLWLKTAYAWRAGNPPHPESAGPIGALPRPWQGPDARAVVIRQWQGDAHPVSGFTSTVDCNEWVASDTEAYAEMRGNISIRAFQGLRGLVVDGILGPKTFAAMTV